jgi:hypothetical protein
MAEKTFSEQSNYGWGRTFNLLGKVPAVSKRIFDTLADAQGIADLEFIEAKVTCSRPAKTLLFA